MADKPIGTVTSAYAAAAPVCAVTVYLVQLNIQLYLAVGANEHSHLIHDFSDKPESPHQMHLNQFSHFCMAHSCASRHTNQHSDPDTWSATIGHYR